jgi:hypothetical protein
VGGLAELDGLVEEPAAEALTPSGWVDQEPSDDPTKAGGSAQLRLALRSANDSD